MMEIIKREEKNDDDGAQVVISKNNLIRMKCAAPRRSVWIERGNKNTVLGTVTRISIIRKMETAAVNGDSSPQTTKNAIATKKLSDLEKEYKKQAIIIKQSSRQLELSRKENENLQKEYNKAMLAKLQLEKLCRELQKQNKNINEESLARLKEEEEKRKESSASFQKQINQILAMIKESKDSNEKLQEDKAKMSQHFQYLVEQTQAKNAEIEKIDKQMELTTQLNDAKVAKVQMEAAIEKETLLKEKHDMLIELKNARKQLSECQAKEKVLTEQLNIYTSKYDEFQSSFAKSNDIFVTYKTEMEKMAKNIAKLEKESTNWKIKFEKSNLALLELASEKQVRDQILTKTTRQLAQLQKLCRTLQSERTVLIQALTDNNIEIPAHVPDNEPSPPPPELPKLAHENDDKLNMMTKNCAELKQNLANLQNQLSSITNEPAKKNKNKNKKKNKKNGEGSENAKKEESVELETESSNKEEITDQLEKLTVDAPPVEEKPIETSDSQVESSVPETVPETIATESEQK